MLFLVFFQFSSFDINQFNLAVQVFLDGFVFFYLFIKVAFFLVYGLFFLTDPVFRII